MVDLGIYHAHAENAPDVGQTNEGIVEGLALKLAALLPDHAPVVTAGVPVNEPSGTGALSAVILAASNV